VSVRIRRWCTIHHFFHRDCADCLDKDYAELERELAEAVEKLARIESEACVCDQIRYPLSQGCIVHDKQSVIARILKEG